MSVRKSANGHANGNPVTTDADWWRQATVYQIYPRSFADENGDGMGDLKGITARVPYLKELGIDAVWLSPFYPSALKDGGYDVADYRDVDPKIGTLEDFDAMAAALKAAGIKTIVDIVPNHSSDDHVWFQEALKSPKGSKERERYIFRDGKGADKSEPPNDWRCLFGGSAWDPVGDGQFYLHLFDSSQPDFNWDNREVKDDFLKTLRFWADRGVSGFRVDVAHGCAKDMSEPFASQAELDKLQAKNLVPGAPRDAHPFWDRSKVHEIFAEWRGVFNEYEPPLTAVAEAWVAPDKKHLYASSEGLGQSFSFDMLVCAYQAPVMKELIDNSLKDARSSGSSTTWVLSNHDVIRHATRYGLEGSRRIQDNTDPQGMKYCNEFLVSGGKGLEPELGLKRARAATLMMLALPGSTYLYQGEELGLPEVVDMPAKDRQDPIFIRSQGKEIGRDGCRVPIPWSTSAGSNDSFGFSPDGTKKPPHLPMPDWMGQYSVQALDKDEKSTLNLYRRALKLKKELRSDKDEIEWATQDGYKDGYLHFRRPGGWEVLFNVDKKDGVDVPEGEVLVASGDLENGKVPINTTIWLKN